MILQLSNWGNSLAMRIPREYRDALDLKVGSKVDVTVKDNSLVIKLADMKSLSNKIDLKKLMNGVTIENSPDSDQFEDDTSGEEIW